MEKLTLTLVAAAGMPSLGGAANAQCEGYGCWPDIPQHCHPLPQFHPPTPTFQPPAISQPFQPTSIPTPQYQMPQQQTTNCQRVGQFVNCTTY